MSTYLNDDEARELARRWEKFGTLGTGGAPVGALDSLEWERLRGWVRRRMAREVVRREGNRLAAEAHSAGVVLSEAARDAAERYDYDWLPSDDREALAHAVMVDLALGDDPHGAHGQAWDLCFPTSAHRKPGRMRRRAIRRALRRRAIRMARRWGPPAIWGWRRHHEPGWHISFMPPCAGYR